ncbi:MAG: hypothetical protein JXA54_14425 [Candidatus Heimdallarchaeota archaeon]|nr:hypothetical protein [Candidatus Heimdallarchaeota archaeon]
MKSSDKIDIPLILQMVDPLAIFVVNNENRGFELFYDIEQHPFKSYQLLFNLFKDSTLQRELPEELTEHFKVYHKKIILKEAFFERCFGGSHHILQRYDCIDFNTTIIHLPEPTVLLSNFKYGRDDKGTIIDLDINVNLTIREAFLIFSNICSNIMYLWWWNLSSPTIVENIYNRDFFLDYITQRTKDVHEKFLDIHLYTYEYLAYIYKLIIEEKISPIELLRLNGAPTLAIFHSLPQVRAFLKSLFCELDDLDGIHESRKIIYLQFLLHLYDKWLDETIDKNAPAKIGQLKKFVLKEFYEVELNKTLVNKNNHQFNKK